MNISVNSVKLSGKFLAACLLGIALLFGEISPARAQVSLGSAADFSILGGTNVTCTGGSASRSLGVYPGNYVDTGCTVTGESPPTSNATAILAQTNFLRAYSALQSKPCTETI